MDDITLICDAAAHLREAMREIGLDGTISVNVHVDRDAQAINAMLERANPNIDRTKRDPNWICDINGIPFYAKAEFKPARAYRRGIPALEREKRDD